MMSELCCLNRRVSVIVLLPANLPLVHQRNKLAGTAGGGYGAVPYHCFRVDNVILAVDHFLLCSRLYLLSICLNVYLV